MKKITFTIAAAIIFSTCSNPSSDQTKKETTKMSFKKADWIKSTNVYEVNLRQYTKEGTINAFLKELPRLKAMGVQTLWFMPITPIAKKNKKGSMGSYYACSDYTSVSPEFGTVEDFKAFVKEAHTMGFKVIMDWVANHTGWDHVWTITHPNYYEKDSATNDFKIASGMDDIIELDYKNPDLRKAMIDAMQFWVKECDIDGYRCDLAFWVELDFWKEARAELEKTKTLFWLAESDPLEKPEYYEAFDACYTWTWMHKTEDFYKKNQDIKILDSVLQCYDTAGGKNKIKLWFTTNHDENSWNGTEYEKYGDAALALAVFSFTWDGIPLVYSGQELPNKKRLKFFDKDAIEWNGTNQLESFYKILMVLKANNPALHTGEENVTTTLIKTSTGKNVLAYFRKNGTKEVFVLLNLSNRAVKGVIDDKLISGQYKNVFTGTSAEVKDFDLQPWEYRVFEK